MASESDPVRVRARVETAKARQTEFMVVPREMGFGDGGGGCLAGGLKDGNLLRTGWSASGCEQRDSGDADLLFAFAGLGDAGSAPGLKPLVRAASFAGYLNLSCLGYNWAWVR